jgi:glycosyltransferase involved in cell wall biosynthesis
MKMCQAFANNGHEVILLTPDNKRDIEPFVEDVFSYYGVARNFQLQKLPWLKFKGRGYIYGWLAAKAAIKHNTDLVFCRNLVGCYFAALCGQKVVFESHAPVADSGRIIEWLFKKLIMNKKLKNLVVITDALKVYYEERYPGLIGKIQVAPDGADPVSENIEAIELPNKGERLQVGYVGHLYAGRGVELIGELAKRCDWADFHLVGGVQSDVVKWSDKLKSVKNCIFHGFVSPSLAERYRAGFDVLLAPYQLKVSVSGGGDTSRWMSPLKVFEYMSSRKAIIASDLPALREVLSDGVNALLCDPEKIDEWQEELTRLKEDRSLIHKLAVSAYSSFSKNYTWKARAEKVLGNL